MDIKKNEIYETEIFDLTAEGLGVGKVDGVTVFVPNTAIGDKLKIKITKVTSHLCYARVEELLSPSSDRIKNDCPAFPFCGGCTLRHINYKAELKFKENRVFETMRRIGNVEIPPENILFSVDTRYRNKAQYPVSENGFGFYAARTHRVVPCKDCLLSPPEFSRAANEFWEFLKQNNISVFNSETNTGLVRHFYIRKGFMTDEIGVTIVVTKENIKNADGLVLLFKSLFGENLKSVVLNINPVNNNVILGKKNKVLYGTLYITDILCGVRVRLSPNSFYQVNHAGATKLYEKIKEYAAPNKKTVLDLYCGTGTIGLSLSSAAKEIIGVEIVEDAVKDAAENAKQNGITNARFICGDAAAAAKKLNKENLSPDTVILDPPRKGCEEELLKTVADGFNPERIVYVSCNVATLARDVKILSALGYTLKAYTPVDMFPRTAHVETVALLTK